MGGILALLVGLAFWQVQRGQEKTRLLAHFDASHAAPPHYEMSIEQARALLEQETVFVRACLLATTWRIASSCWTDRRRAAKWDLMSGHRSNDQLVRN